jgi:hypothetical protein
MTPALEIAAWFGDVVTSGKEGFPGDDVHSKNSLHYDGLAIDVRPYWDDVKAQMEDYFNAGYTVIWEEDHVHVSFDPEGRRK